MPKLELPKGTLLNQRFEIQKYIASGSIGSTYLAYDKNSKENPVALKVFNFREIENWKEFDLFQKEIETLKNLNHPNIPDYITDFKQSLNGQTYYVLAQEYVPAKNLEQRVASGERFTVDKVEEILKTLLEILIYIHSQGIIHRDINPKNVLLSDDGKVYLVDFSAVGKENVSDENFDFVGTLGYIPPEQLYGKPVPASDLYGLGMILIYVLSGRSPQDFELDGMKLNYKDFVNIPVRMRFLIDKMIITDVNKRLSGAKRALDYLLDKEEAYTFSESQLVNSPTKLKIENKDNALKISKIPRKRLHYFIFLLFSVVWITVVITFSTAGPLFFKIIAVSIFGSIGLVLAGFALYGLLVKSKITVDRENIYYKRCIFGISVLKESLPVKNISKIDFKESGDKFVQIYYTVEILTKQNALFVMGTGKGLNKTYAMVIQNAICGFIKNNN